MDNKQLKNSGSLVASNLVINLSGFLRQVLMAYFLGATSKVDLLLMAMIAPSIIQSMIGGGAGEIMVIKREDQSTGKGSFETRYIFACLLPVIILGILYYLSLDYLDSFFEISQPDSELFHRLSLVYIIAMIPGTFNSILRPRLYSEGLYRFYNKSTIISQFAGLILILVLINRFGIYSFAISFLFTTLLNAIWFSFRSGLYPAGLFDLKGWKDEAQQLYLLLKRVFSLSLQTLINHFATFWERSLSVKYLKPGFLSSINYARTLSELPNSVLLSSVLTTSYIEQVKHYNTSYRSFTEYTSKTLNLLLKTGFFIQVLMILFAPAIVIMVFRRGEFDNNAVATTVLIFNIFTIGFLPRIIMNFFSRTMYILGEYKKLLLAIFLKFIIHIVIMIALVNRSGYSIPAAAVTGYIFLSVWLFRIIAKKTQLPGLGLFILKIFLTLVISLVLLIVHKITLDYYLSKTNLEISIMVLPFALISGGLFFWYLDRMGIAPGIIKKITSAIWKREK